MNTRPLYKAKVQRVRKACYFWVVIVYCTNWKANLHGFEIASDTYQGVLQILRTLDRNAMIIPHIATGHYTMSKFLDMINRYRLQGF